MGRGRMVWLGAAVAVALAVAIQTVMSTAERSAMVAADPNVPTVTAGVDVLARSVSGARAHPRSRLPAWPMISAISASISRLSAWCSAEGAAWRDFGEASVASYAESIATRVSVGRRSAER